MVPYVWTWQSCTVLISLFSSIDIKRFSCGRVRTKLETQVNYPKTLSILPEVAADKGMLHL